MSLPPILDVRAVMDRYSLRDPRSARRIMREAGAFTIAGRLVVRQDDLDTHERAKATRARAENTREAQPVQRRRNTRQKPAQRLPAVLPPGWWREQGRD